MIVRWTDTALGHLSAIHDYIAQDSPLYARGVIDRLTERSKQLTRFPESGRMVRGFEAKDTRQLLEGIYRIIYRVRPDRVEVLAVVHAAREFPGRITHFDVDP